MDFYVGLEKYRKGDGSSFVRDPSVRGCILGDLACEEYMFDYGEAGLYQMLREIQETAICCGRDDFDIIYQLPLYITGRNISALRRRVAFLYEETGVRKFLLNDIGVLRILRNKYEDSFLIWGDAGIGRNRIVNGYYVQFLAKEGLNGFLSNRVGLLERLTSFGVEPWTSYGTRYYKSVNRECYSKYFSGCREDCGGACRAGDYYLADGKYKIRADGYFLGKKIIYPKDSRIFMDIAKLTNRIILFAQDYEEAIRHERELIQHSL